ncbi:fungal specific transcription factor [Colletotrichum kahawae]|uniref:Fungal specific transcription factor n=1 Tax=Colletotrichum kahawae TaxID=34407 RepID=A0AAE0D2Y6_COLKA|nr:fungal specific transcription factor [Colletotrichum kahawae]
MTISQKDAKEIHDLPWAPTFWLGNVGHYAFTCHLGGDDFEVTLRIPRPPEKEEFVSWGRPCDLAPIAEDFSLFCEPVRHAIRLSIHAECQEFALFTGSRLDRIVAHDAVALIGDASHPLSGALGAGAGFALEDVYALSRCLSWAWSHRWPLGVALEYYDRIRTPHYRDIYCVLGKVNEVEAAVAAENLDLDAEVQERVRRTDEARDNWVYYYEVDKKQQAPQVNDELDCPDQSAQQQHEAGPVEQDTALSPFLMLPDPEAHDEQDSMFMASSLPSLKSSASHGRRRMELPSEDVVRHVIDVYLATFNSVLPLFFPPSLHRVVDNWYCNATDRNGPLSWATMNIVLALARCHGHVQLSPNAVQAVDIAECLANAQLVLADVLAGDMDLQSIQILLGIGILFMGARPADVRAPIIFVSTAMRLVQAMGMHRGDSYKNTEPVEDMQRRRVFWIAYILDRDVAARTRQAPIQHDADMDLDLPPVNDEVAMAVAADVSDAGAGDDNDDNDDTDAGACARGLAKLNLFRARVELAQIQGRVYDCVFSVRARYMDAGEKARLAQGIRLSIQQWKARLPISLGVEFLSSQNENDGSTSATILPAVMCYMHSLMTMCLGQLCGVSSMEFHWIEEVLSYARGLGDYKTTPSFASPLSTIPPPPPSPQGWNVLVSQCREFTRLFLSIRSRHPTFVNVQLCPFTSSLLCLSVNSFLNFEDGNRMTDQRLMVEAATLLGEVMQQTQSEIVSKVLEVYMEFDWHLILLMTELTT